MTANKTLNLSNPKLFNPVYIPFLSDNTEFLHFYGGAGSGKSRFVAQKEIIKTFDKTRIGKRCLVIRKIGRTLKDSVYTELKQVYSGWGFYPYFDALKSPLSITNKLTGSEILFSGLDDIEKIKSFSNIDRIWIEEATELENFEELRQLRLRIRGFKNPQLTLSYNPIDENHFLNQQIHLVKADGHKIVKTTFRDNVRLQEKDQKYFQYLLSLEGNYKRIYAEGLWGRVLEGLIFENYTLIDYFGKTETETDPHQSDVEFYGLDFGFTDPTALIACRVQDALPKRELIMQEVLYKSGLDSDNLVSEFNRLQIRKDRDIIADNARPELIAALRKYGYRVRACEKGTGSVLTGINKMRNFILRPVRGSKNLIAELNNYQKNQRQGIWLEEPATNQADHAIDAARYGIQSLDKAGFDAVPFRF
jgi:phage terminase large subunit